MVKVPRLSSTFSAEIWGVWNSIIAEGFLRLCSPHAPAWAGASLVLLRVELDDELLLDRRGDLGPLWQAEDLRGQPVVVCLQPRRHYGGELGGFTDDGLDRRARLHRDHVFVAQLVRGDVDPAAVDRPVAVADHLPRLAPRSGEAEPHEHVVEARLEQPQQVLARHARLSAGLGVVVAELLLQHAVVAAGPLLLPPLQPVLPLARAAAPLVAG